MPRLLVLLFILSTLNTIGAQTSKWDTLIRNALPRVIERHREFVRLPNISFDREGVRKNMEWAKTAFELHGFEVSLLEAPNIPVFLAERRVDEDAPTILYYFHIDGQAVNPENRDQEDPFKPVLKKQTKEGDWEVIPWASITKRIDPD